MVCAMNRRSFDGMILGGAGGQQYRVCEPAWWQVGRWLALWFAKERGHVLVSMITGKNLSLRTVRYHPVRRGRRVRR